MYVNCVCLCQIKKNVLPVKKNMQKKHRVFSCRYCKRYVHKKCMNISRKAISLLKLDEYVCINCSKTNDELSNSETMPNRDKNVDSENIDQINDPEENFNASDIIIDKYDNMMFNPIRFQNNSKEDDFIETNHVSKCNYMTPEEFGLKYNCTESNFSILNANIRSISKNFEKLKECLKTLDHEFTIIGLSETHLKESPSEYYNLNGYNIEFTNRVERQKGGVCLYVSSSIKYKLRSDLCIANSNFESCFIEIENTNTRNTLVGVIYRSHTAIDHFVADIGPIFDKLTSEKKKCYIMGDFNIDLLKDDSDKPTHEYLNLVYSYSFIPTIYKPTRITEQSATIIDNILVNNHDDINSAIIVTDISDHLPTILIENHSIKNQSTRGSKHFFKRNHSPGNINHLQQKLSNVNWYEELENEDANDSYNKFVKIFTVFYDECIPMKKYKCNNKKEPRFPWISRGLLKGTP